MWVPLCGADLRQVYVLAGPHSIVVEIRTRKAIDHAHAVITEVQDERITREFRLNAEIKEGATALRRIGDELEITCMKADGPEDRIWSELVRFNTRASVGSI
jgi:HSP20 family molecular chaperone IbpA